jgi:hypothetical protein
VGAGQRRVEIRKIAGSLKVEAVDPGLTSGDLRTAAARLRDAGKSPPVGDVRLESLREGRCVQLLHVRPYDRETGTIPIE